MLQCVMALLSLFAKRSALNVRQRSDGISSLFASSGRPADSRTNRRSQETAARFLPTIDFPVADPATFR